ncbi:MAG: outer membrane lipid asymmetry maintenance protein MlaD [Pseudomonadota bacterium]
MAESTAEALVGALVIAVAGGFVVYAATTADLGIGAGSGGTELVAEFRKAEGLAPGGDVRIAGVRVGSITSMALDPDSYRARITIALQPGVQVPDDSAAKITANSLLGDSYILIDPGASEFMLADGESIAYTQDSVNLIDMVGRFITGSTSE